MHEKSRAHSACGCETLKVFAYNGGGSGWNQWLVAESGTAPHITMGDTRGGTRTVIVDTRGWKEAESGPTLGDGV
jgi:hypothetical protein